MGWLLWFALFPFAIAETSREQMRLLADDLEQTQQYVKALPLRQQLVAHAGASKEDWSLLAGLCERLGEMALAEAAWKRSGDAVGLALFYSGQRRLSEKELLARNTPQPTVAEAPPPAPNPVPAPQQDSRQVMPTIPCIRSRGAFRLVPDAHAAVERGDAEALRKTVEQAIEVAMEVADGQQVLGLLQIAEVLQTGGQDAAARRLATDAMRLLDQWLGAEPLEQAGALVETAGPLLRLGLAHELEQAAHRAELLVAGRMDPEFARIGTSPMRVALLQIRQDHHGVIAELRDTLERVDKRSGPKSDAALEAVERLIEAYQIVPRWSEEEPLWLRLLELTGIHRPRSEEHIRLFGRLAERAKANGENEKAIDWWKRGEQIAGGLR